jgi:transposase InsO family protein
MVAAPSFALRGSSRFTRFLEDYGIEQMIAQTPNVNGKLENLNQQVEKEVLLVTNFASVEHFKQELAKWVGHYNFSRPHQGLGDRQVPADRYFPGTNTWFGKNSEITRQQSLIAETMATLLSELKKS